MGSASFGGWVGVRGKIRPSPPLTNTAWFSLPVFHVDCSGAGESLMGVAAQTGQCSSGALDLAAFREFCSGGNFWVLNVTWPKIVTCPNLHTLCAHHLTTHQCRPPPPRPLLYHRPVQTWRPRVSVLLGLFWRYHFCGSNPSEFTTNPPKLANRMKMALVNTLSSEEVCRDLLAAPTIACLTVGQSVVNMRARRKTGGSGEWKKFFCVQSDPLK